MFLIIAIGLTIGITYLLNNLHDKYTMLEQKVFTSTANILTDVEVHTNFEIIPAIHNQGDGLNLGYIYGVKNKTIYYKKDDNIIRTKNTTYDMTKAGYELCSFRPTLTGWILLYRTIASPKKVLFSIRDNNFTESITYGDWTYNMFLKGSICSYQHPYAWIITDILTQREVIKMDITQGTWYPSEMPNFDGNYTFTGSIFQTENRKILIDDFINYLQPNKIINNCLLFYDGTYIYYVPNDMWDTMPSTYYSATVTFYPWKAVKINE